MSGIKFTRRRILMGAAVLLGSTVLSRGGWAQSTPAYVALAGAGEPVSGGRLIVAADSEPRNLNPAIVASNGVFFVASKIIEPLAEASFEASDGLAPRLAVAWAGSDDGLTVSFTLREGVKWHDGVNFTSKDVAFSALEVWRKLQNLGRVVFQDLVAVETPTEHSAIFHFSKPTPFQLIRNALPALTSVIPQHIFAQENALTEPDNKNLIGTGPFKFAEYKAGEYYRLSRNEHYWGEGRPYLDEIIYRVLSDRSSAAAALEAEEIDLAAFSAVPLSYLATIAQQPGLSVVTTGYEALTYQLVVEINHRRKELADLKVRQAIAHAIDKDFVINTIFLNYAKAATGPVPQNDRQFYQTGLPAYDFDTEKANSLLDEAGYPRGQDGVRFRLKLLPAPYFNETRQFGDYLRQALAVIGIDAQLINNDAAGHQKAVYTDHDFDLAVAPPVYRGDPAISTTILVESNIPDGVPFSNQGGYINSKLDTIIKQAARELDEAKRIALYAEFQQLVAEDLPLINVAEWGFTTVARDRVRNIANNPRWAVSNWADTWIRD